MLSVARYANFCIRVVSNLRGNSQRVHGMTALDSEPWTNASCLLKTMRQKGCRQVLAAGLSLGGVKGLCPAPQWGPRVFQRTGYQLNLQDIKKML